MRPLAIRLGVLVLAVLVAVQFALPAYLEGRTEDRLTEHGGSAEVEMTALPAPRLLFGDGDDLEIRARGLSFDLEPGQRDVFKRLDDFGEVSVQMADSRAGPFAVSDFQVRRTAERRYDVVVAGDGTAGDVARYAGSRLGGGFGQALAGLAAGVLGDLGRPIPFSARMEIDTSGEIPRAHDVVGQVAGLPAGPLAQIVANALLSAL